MVSIATMSSYHGNTSQEHNTYLVLFPSSLCSLPLLLCSLKLLSLGQWLCDRVMKRVCRVEQVWGRRRRRVMKVSIKTLVVWCELFPAGGLVEWWWRSGVVESRWGSRRQAWWNTRERWRSRRQTRRNTRERWGSRRETRRNTRER